MKFEDLVLGVIVFAYLGAGIGFPCYIMGLHNSMGDVPGWANETAQELTDHGGDILYYTSEDDIDKYTVDTNDKVRADKMGFRIYFNNGDLRSIPYDRFAGMTLNKGGGE